MRHVHVNRITQLQNLSGDDNSVSTDSSLRTNNTSVHRHMHRTAEQDNILAC